MPDQILIELILDDRGTIESTIDELVRLGKVDKDLGEQAKVANKEFANQLKTFQSSGANVDAFKKSFVDVTKIFNQFPEDFKKGWNEGIIDILKKAGVSIEDFTKSVNDVLDDIANEEAIAALEKEVASLEQQMIDAKAAGKELSGEYIDMAKRVEFLKEQIKEFNEQMDNDAAVNGFKKLKDELADLKTKMADALAAGKGNTEQYTQMADKAKLLADTIQKINDEINDTPKPTGFKSIHSEINELVTAIANARLNNQAFGEDFAKMEERLRALKQALSETNAATGEAIDTSKIDLAVESTSGLVDIFEVAGETTEVFGLRMSGLAGTLANTEGALKAFTNVQKIYEALTAQSTLATQLHNAAQGLFSVVVGKSTGALKTFRIALASTGIGLLVILIGALVANWDKVKEVIGGVSREQKDVLDSAKESIENREKELEVIGEGDALLRKQGLSEGEILKKQDEVLKKRIEVTKQILIDLETQKTAQAEITKSQIEAAQRNKDILAGIIKFLTFPVQQLLNLFNFVAKKLHIDIDVPNIAESVAGSLFDPGAIGEEGDKAQKEIDEHIRKVQEKLVADENRRTEIAKAANEQRLKDIVSNIEAQLSAARKGSKEELDLQKKLLIAKANLDLNGAKTAAERREITAKLHKDLLDMEREFEENRAKIRIEGMQIELDNLEKLTEQGVIKRQEGERKILDLKKKILDEQTALELKNEELTDEQKKNLVVKNFNEKNALERDFQKQLKTTEIQDEIDKNNAKLAVQNISLEKRKELEIANINLAADLEVAAAKGNSEKIVAINAQRQANILAAEINRIRESVEMEIDEFKTTNAAHLRSLERTLNDDKKSIKDRRAAQHELTEINLEEVNKRLDGLREEKRLGLVIGEKAEKEYNQKYAELLDEREQITEADTQKSIELRQEQLNKTAELISQIGSTVSDVFNFLNDAASQREQNRIDVMKKALADAEEAGALTEKQVISRQKRIEAEEKKAKINEARREKSMAIFQAIINTAAAVTKVLANPVLAAIVAAQGAIQIALIAARPLPRFGKGKKEYQRYEGWAELGETGPELFERNKELFYIPEKTVTWISSSDKIYNPKETEKILEQSSSYSVDKELMKTTIIKEITTTNNIDYKRMGKEIGKHIKNVNVMINNDGTTEEQRSYFNNKYSFKK